MKSPSLNHPAPINDEMDRVLAGERIQLQVWLANKLVLRTWYLKAAPDDIRCRDEVVLEVADA